MLEHSLSQKRREQGLNYGVGPRSDGTQSRAEGCAFPDHVASAPSPPCYRPGINAASPLLSPYLASFSQVTSDPGAPCLWLCVSRSCAIAKLPSDTGNLSSVEQIRESILRESEKGLEAKKGPERSGRRSCWREEDRSASG